MNEAMRPCTKTGHITERDRYTEIKERNLATTYMCRVSDREASRVIFTFWLAQLKV